MHAIALIVMNLRQWRVDGDLAKVRAAEAVDLAYPRRSGCDRPAADRWKSMPGTMCAGQKATCSVSAKKLSGFRRAPTLPMRSGAGILAILQARLLRC